VQYSHPVRNPINLCRACVGLRRKKTRLTHAAIWLADIPFIQCFFDLVVVANGV